MIALNTLKEWLGVSGSTYDTLLTDLESRAVAWVQKQTGRYFGAEVSGTDIVIGNGSNKLWLPEPPSDVILTVTERAYLGADEETITAADDDGFVVRTGGNEGWLQRKNQLGWQCGYEYSVTFERGYVAGAEPGDIRQLVLELCKLKWAEVQIRNPALKSETAAGYSYTNFEPSESFDGLPLSGTAQATLLSWRRWNT